MLSHLWARSFNQCLSNSSTVPLLGWHCCCMPPASCINGSILLAGLERRRAFKSHHWLQTSLFSGSPVQQAKDQIPAMQHFAKSICQTKHPEVLIPSVIIGHGVPVEIKYIFTYSRSIKHVKNSKITLVPAALCHFMSPKFINHFRTSTNSTFKSGFVVRLQTQQ